MLRTRRRPPSVAETHRAWLELVDTDGPFLSVPVLKDVWPQGMPRLSEAARAELADARPAFESAWEKWDASRDDTAALERYREARDAWVDTVLRDVVGWGRRYVTDLSGAATADAARGVRSPDGAVTVVPTGALVHGDAVGALVLVIDPVDSLRALVDDGWAATPVDRMEELLRAAGVAVGVVTDGRWWGLVCARTDALAASGIVDSHTWTEEPRTRDAFIELLRLRWLVGGRADERLPELFKRSVAEAEEITEALGRQVRRAVELLVRALSEAGLDARERGEPDPLPADRERVYEAAVTVLMRVVFLLFAEERGLLPQSSLFAFGYGLSGELDALESRRLDEGGESLDGTRFAWHRMLATSQALYRGASFEDLRLPAYGGSLFDPDRFSFLLARGSRGTLLISVSDLVMHQVLRAVQTAELPGEPARRITFRDIDVEQIGYIYEGLLGYSCVEVDEVTVGLKGTPGAEPEIPLATLESLAAGAATPAKLAGAVLAWVKQDQPAAKPPTKNALATAITAEVPDAEHALRAVTADAALRDRLRPLIGIIRRDLRDRPFVVRPGGVLVVETPSRATAGAHYTPRDLAEGVVKHALEPLVYRPGPYDTTDSAAWRLLDPDQILARKVADIACGSGAFLVGAARYLAGRLVEAWHRDGTTAGWNAHDLEIHAIREVVARCLYGADINAMAVEMCKLSLWLVSLDPKLPFSFVDDKILHGSSLLGLTDVRQLKKMHIDPDAAGNQPALFDLDVDEQLDRAARLRAELASEVDERDPHRSATAKRRQLARLREMTAELTDVADGVIATGLRHSGKPGKALNVSYENLRIAVGNAYPQNGEPDRSMFDAILADGLTPTVPTDYDRWRPLHWILAVPDVMSRGGFDAIIGNPPFVGGQKLTGTLGTNVRDWFVNVLAHGKRGSADLVAYFFLRAYGLLTPRGTFGLIGTNSVAQNVTREVGLDQIVAAGFTIMRAVQSGKWPVATVNLEYAAVWGTRREVPTELPRIADDVHCARIDTMLDAAGRVDGVPVRLVENKGITFQGCIVLGEGFVLDPEEAKAWASDPRNAEVLFPYLDGDDLNSRPDCSASRWVIDFNDRTKQVAKEYELPYRRLVEAVKPERAKKSKAVRNAPWWLFLRARPAMRKAVTGLDEMLVITRHSKSLMPVRVRTDVIPSEATVVFATDRYDDQAVLSSNMHQLWAIKYGSGLRADPRYAPSAVFLTFPRPEPTEELAEVGRVLDAERRRIMLRRGLGLTKLYNLVNDPDLPDEADPDVARMREIHVKLDQVVMSAYGWDDVLLDHAFHTYRQMTRWTPNPVARVEILDRLLEENHRRAAGQGEAPPADESADEADDADAENGDGA